VQSFFAVDQTSGEVTVMRALDRDIAAVVRITVLVIDTTAPTTQQGKGILCFHLSSSLSVCYRSVQTSQREQYHQTAEAEETV
jgi:hypothetical protein